MAGRWAGWARCRRVEEETGQRLEEVGDSIKIGQRRSIGFYGYLIGAVLMIAAGVAEAPA